MSLDFFLRCRHCESRLVSLNITHNLTGMAAEAGIYKAIWRPEEIGATRAMDITPALREGLGMMLSAPDRFKRLNPENGWGDYDGFVEFVKEVHEACVLHPSARIEVSR